MTTNQIAYWANQEAARANRAREQETARHNLAQEREATRSAVAKEIETARHNVTTESETERHNRATIGQRYADTAVKAVDTIWKNTNDSVGLKFKSIADAAKKLFSKGSNTTSK